MDTYTKHFKCEFSKWYFTMIIIYYGKDKDIFNY